MSNTLFHHSMKRGYLENNRGHNRYIEDMFEDIDGWKKHLHQGFTLLGILPELDDHEYNPEKIGHKIYYTCECEDYE